MFKPKSEHSPLPQQVMDVILKARILAAEAGADEIGADHVIGALNSTTTPTDRPGTQKDMPLAEEVKAALKRAIGSAGGRDRVTVTHLRSALA